MEQEIFEQVIKRAHTDGKKRADEIAARGVVETGSRRAGTAAGRDACRRNQRAGQARRDGTVTVAPSRMDAAKS